MSALDPKTRSLIELARKAEDPSSADRARIRRKLGVALGAGLGAAAAGVASGRGLDSGTHFANPASLPAAAKTASLLGLLKGAFSPAALWLAAGSVVGGAALLFAAKSAVLPATPAEPAPAAIGHASTSSQRAVPDTSPHGRVAATTEAESRGSAAPPTDMAAPNTPPAIAAEDLPELDSAQATTGAAASRAAKADARKARSSSLVPQPVLPRRRLSLAEEARELSSVHAALREGQASDALARLDSMDRRPGGALREERTAARVLALCGLGRVREAENAARRFRALAPESPLLPRLSGSCAHNALSNSPGSQR